MEINPAVTFKHDRSVMYAKRPRVLIVGAGLAGLTLGILLHKAGIPFEIYERAAEVKPLGSVMYFNCTTANLFKQYGANGYIVSRPQIYDLLLRQIPKERVHLGKKVLSMDQGGNGVLIRFSDKSEAEGDILVGADGAYSAVRQGLGTATSPEYCVWGAILFLDEETSKDNDAFRNSEWGPEAAAAMCEQVKDFPIISGGDKILTLQDLIDRSPKELISKVMLEEKVFKTWYDCRTVLIGDVQSCWRCGAANAMHDAIALANRQRTPFILSRRRLKDAFKAYQEERIDWVEKAFDTSKVFRTMAGQQFCCTKAQHDDQRLFRYCFRPGPSLLCLIDSLVQGPRYIMKHTPTWVMLKLERRQFTNRPQAAFLPAAEDKGIVEAAPQPSLSIKTLRD
ncbi:hypothetical protein F5H01DRAFT_401385 [Linnemannia elongata]|nr:hypothetical protein F5H01DRAFT_401385 [Linnemannia elongata]